MKLNRAFLLLFSAFLIAAAASCDNTNENPVKDPGIYVKVTDSETGESLDDVLIRTCYSFDFLETIDSTDPVIYPNPATFSTNVKYSASGTDKNHKISITKINNTDEIIIHEGLLEPGEYVNEVHSMMGETQLEGFYYVNHFVGDAKTKNLLMFYTDNQSVISLGNFSYILAMKNTDNTGSAYFSYDIYPLAGSGSKITRVDEAGVFLGTYQFKNEVIIDISKPGYINKQIAVPIDRTKAHDLEVKLTKMIID